jgi:hypothetical protein
MSDTYVNARWKDKATGKIIHPETEVDMLKSGNGNALATIISTLLKAATTTQARQAIESAAASHQHTTGDITSFASEVISAIGSETLSALGVSYSITTNGYICFGQLFGGLILQWNSSVWGKTTSHEICWIECQLPLVANRIFYSYPMIIYLGQSFSVTTRKFYVPNTGPYNSVLHAFYDDSNSQDIGLSVITVCV